jgi:hypothetical protein
LRQPRNYGALRDTQRQADEPGISPPETPERAAHRPNYAPLHDTQQRIDEQARADEAAEQRTQRPILRRWTHRGGMVPQQESATIWNRQDIEIRKNQMAENDKTEANKEGEGTQRGVDENDPELQEAKAVVEDARRREAAERARQQERGMER